MDKKQSEERRSLQVNTRHNDYRSVYDVDYARVIHSAAFRRLQRKTQVLGLGDGDFYRTRLTHTIEVTQIANGICNFLVKSNKLSVHDEIFPPASLISCICACHDIGHPPFGHGGEVALNIMMRNHGGFEGNAHTLRLLTKYEQRVPEFGLDLTRRTLLGLIKYPITYSNAVSKVQPVIHGDLCQGNINYRKIKSSEWKPPKCIFDEEDSVFQWLLEPFSSNDKVLFKNYKEPCEHNQHNKATNKTFDASIMDVADDISYGVHDLEDAIHLNMIRKQDFQDHLERCNVQFTTEWAKEHGLENLVSNLFGDDKSKRKYAIGGFINALISSVCIKNNSNISSKILGSNLELNVDAKKSLDAFKSFIYENMVRSPEVQTFEYRGQIMLMEMFDALITDPTRFLPRDNVKKFNEQDTEAKRMRFVCDYIAGMTDDYATRIYERFFIPRSGSVFQKI